MLLGGAAYTGAKGDKPVFEMLDDVGRQLHGKDSKELRPGARASYRRERFAASFAAMTRGVPLETPALTNACADTQYTD